MNQRLSWTILHTVAAIAFFFTLQRFGLKASLDTSLLWAAVGGVIAAWLAWQQGSRGS